MTPSHQILIGDCLDMMRTLPDQSVQCCVTSPHYFNPEYAAMAERRIAAAWPDGAAQMDVFHDSAPAA
nr:hypothetical protein [uncultured Pseudomonas sp.]